MATYRSCPYNVSDFGVEKINNIMFNSDIDGNFIIKVSFDAGATYLTIDKDMLNKKMAINKNNPKIVVSISLLDFAGKYRIKTNGFFPGVSVGAKLFFKDIVNNNVISTIVGGNGRYQVSLPRGKYYVYKIVDNKKITVMGDFDPETFFNINVNTDSKEDVVSQFMLGVGWMKYCVYDIFDNKNSIKQGSQNINVEGNLCNYDTGAVCRYWAMGFD